ncbi:MAG: adenylate kinase, partial [Actinomycetes bacterium]
MRLLIMGPPGAGKGTQAVNIAKTLNVPHISTGDIYRENMKNETPLGLEAKVFYDKGMYVPDEITNRIVEDRLTWDDAKNGFLLDGYPRTIDQVNFLDQILSKKSQKIEKVLELTIDIPVVVERLLKRAQEQGRIDDTKEVITKRLEVYANSTAPLLAEYKNRGILVQVDGMGSVSEVEEKINSALGN